MSWQEMALKVRMTSNALLNLGIKVQENIGIFSQNSVYYLITDFGAYGVRAAIVPFYATSSEQQIQYMIGDAEIRVLFVGEQEQYDKAMRVFPMCPTLEKIIVFDKSVKIEEKDSMAAMYYSDFLALGEGFPRQSELEKIHQSLSEDDLCNILYTSGTTGESKGVMLTYGQYHAAFKANDECVPVGEADRVMNFLPFTHIFERAWTYLCLTEGAELIINTYPKEIQENMRQQHPTCMCAVPRFWEKVYQGVMAKIDGASRLQKEMMLGALKVGRKYNIEYISRGKRPPLALKMEYELVNKTLFSIVRHQLGLENPNIFPTAGATVSSTVEEFVHSIGIGMVVGYGLTESLATVSCNHLDKVFTIGSVGRPISSIKIKISEDGEIMLKGPTITKGYYKKEAINQKAFDEEGYFHTGDSGYLKDGELFLKDRIKDLFKTSNGKYIAPQMIESKLLVDKYVDQIAVIADERKFVSALVVPHYPLLEQYAKERMIAYKDRKELLQDKRIVALMQERIDTLQQQLASYEKVKRIVLLEEPFSMEKGELTNTLKIRRQVLNRNYKAQIDALYEECL